MVSLRHLVQESRATFALAVPLMAGQLSQMLMNLMDSAMVGRLGVVPLAAAAFGNSVVAVPTLIGIGLMTAMSVQVSRAHGAGEREETGEMLRHGTVMSIAVGVLLALGCWSLSGSLRYFGQPAAVTAEARTYFLALAVSIVPMLAVLALKQFSESLHHPWPPMLILFGSVPLNGFLNWLMIYGNWRVPPMGLAGAGWATLIARTIAAAVLWMYVTRARRFVGHAPERWLSRLTRARFAAFLKIGTPGAAMLLLESSAFSLAAVMMGWLGAVPLAAHQIALSCAAATFMLPLGLSMATTIRVGRAAGAKEPVRVRTIGISSLLLAAVIMSGCATLLALGGRVIAGGFVRDPEVIEIAVKLLFAAAAFQVFDGLQVVAAGALRGIADVNFPTTFCAIAYWGVALPAAYLLAFRLGYGPVGLWFGLLLGLFTAAALLSARFLSRTRAGTLHPSDRELPVLP
jgi:MATE family multidrug resistance protein